MTDYSKFISPKRRPVDTPEAIIDKNGKPALGTFKSEFKNLNLMDAKKPTPFPNFMKKFRLTLWEAMEIDFEDGYLLTVACDMGLFGVPFALYFDYKTNTLHEYGWNVKSKEIQVDNNLLNGSKVYCHNKEIHGGFTNNLEKGKVKCEYLIPSKTEKHPIKINVELTRVSKPSVVSIPFGKYSPLYTQKDLFSVKGSIWVDGKEIKATSKTRSVIDDHRGYYPRNMHYDWTSFMGMKEGKSFGINLTHNQSSDEENYNENLIWFDNDMSILPPVKFEHINDCKTIEFESPEKTPMKWTIKDQHDMVNLTFDVLGVHKNLTNVAKVIVDAKYFVAFGKINGYVRDEKGKKYEFKDDHAIAEDKTMTF